ncbi:unnamed protein product [Arctogadus glacialis]
MYKSPTDLQIMYLHTSLRVPAIVAVVEVVALSDRPDGSQQALGCGFSVLEMFAGRGEEQAGAGGDRRLILHHGTPRELLHPKFKGAVEYPGGVSSCSLMAVTGEGGVISSSLPYSPDILAQTLMWSDVPRTQTRVDTVVGRRTTAAPPHQIDALHLTPLTVRPSACGPSLCPAVEAAHDGGLLKAIDGAHVECVVKGHPALGSMVHLLPENRLVSGLDNIPGLVPSPTGDALLRPKLLKRTPYCLSRLTVSLQPSLDRFESQLLQLVSADWDATVGHGARRLCR